MAAAIEFALVVFGVFLGFQLTQWNDDRRDRARESSLMLNVAQDLREDVDEMKENERTAASRMAAIDRVLRLAGDWDPPEAFPSSRFPIRVERVPPFDPESQFTIGIETFIFSYFDGNRFAYNALISAQGADAVHDQALLAEIQRYYSAVDQVRTFESSLTENRLRLVDAMQAEGISAVDGSSFEKVASIVAAEPVLRAAMENYWLYANRQVFLTRSLSAEANTLAQRIEGRYAGL